MHMIFEPLDFIDRFGTGVQAALSAWSRCFASAFALW